MDSPQEAVIRTLNKLEAEMGVPVPPEHRREWRMCVGAFAQLPADLAVHTLTLLTRLSVADRTRR